MTDKLKQIIKDELGKLPKESQEAINSLDWVNISEQIGKKYFLTDEEISDFQIETLLAMTGLEDVDFFLKNIEDEVGTSQEEAEGLANEAVEKIFNPISSYYKNKFGENTVPVEEDKDIEDIGGGLDRRFDILTPEMQNIVRDSNYQTKLYEIGKKHNLNIEDMGRLEDVVIDTMTGVTHPDQFEIALDRSLGLPAESIREIVNEVNEKILREIRDTMMGKPKEDKVNKEIEAPKIDKIEDHEVKVLNEHGINIVSPDFRIPELPQPLAQKFTSSFQIPKVETKHEVEMPPKIETLPQPVVPEPPKPKPEAPKSYPPGSDPYRLHPDE